MGSRGFRLHDAAVQRHGGTFAWRDSATIRRAQAQAEKAAGLDPTSAEALAALNNAFYFGWKIEESLAGTRRAIALNPNYATAHHGSV